MLFSSPRYLVFVALTLLLLGITRGLRSRKMLLCAVSCIFYAAWDYRYLGLLILVSGIDYVAAACIARSERNVVRKRWLAVSVVSNLGILGYFKYAGFFLTNLNGIFSLAGVMPLPLIHVLLPAGISFYTFKSMSYTIGVYRKEHPPCTSYHGHGWHPTARSFFCAAWRHVSFAVLFCVYCRHRDRPRRRCANRTLRRLDTERRVCQGT